jgi:hypothetical protein
MSLIIVHQLFGCPILIWLPEQVDKGRKILYPHYILNFFRCSNMKNNAKVYSNVPAYFGVLYNERVQHLVAVRYLTMVPGVPIYSNQNTKTAAGAGPARQYPIVVPLHWGSRVGFVAIHATGEQTIVGICRTRPSGMHTSVGNYIYKCLGHPTLSRYDSLGGLLDLGPWPVKYQLVRLYHNAICPHL